MPQETIRLADLTIGYADAPRPKIVAQHIHASIYGGELTCLLGANGVGKSTLLRTLSAFQPALGGTIYLQGEPISRFDDKQLAKRLSIVLTERTEVHDLTVEELVGLGRTPYTDFWGNLTLHDHEVVERALQQTGIAPLAQRMTHTLSDGERQKAMIAKALAQETPVIFLDEPTSFLDYPSKVEMMQLLRRLSRETGKTIFLSTHDIELALQIADKVWLMNRNLPLHTGTPEDLSLDGTLERTFHSEGIRFDPSAGLFRVTTPTSRCIPVHGEGIAYEMLCKALRRNGIQATPCREERARIEVCCQEATTTPRFLLHGHDGTGIAFHHIGDLLDELFRDTDVYTTQ